MRFEPFGPCIGFNLDIGIKEYLLGIGRSRVCVHEAHIAPPGCLRGGGGEGKNK